ncbi:unnamed protein product [Diabrotica balteata]|uniref:DUF7869 domain-containing protein n=1 Tax=Diabrotica balteata TaxID=107213 RepID=A0A9P0E221_DIABA|nr:unnamed protein product [Diabrotica balteata]
MAYNTSSRITKIIEMCLLENEQSSSNNVSTGVTSNILDDSFLTSVELAESASYPGPSESKENNLHVLKPALFSPVNLEENTHLLNVLASEVTPDDDFSSGSSDLWEPSGSEHEHGNADSEDTQNELDDVYPLAQITVKKRKKGQGPMQRKLRKSRSDKKRKGEEYITAKGKNISAKISIPVSTNCRAKCHEKTASVDLKQIFRDYRNLTTRDTQKRYLASLITVKPKERTRRGNSVKNRQFTVLYKLENMDGNICKCCFLKIFGETRGFLDDVVKKKKASPTSIILKSDLRGMQPSGNKRSEADISFARNFINIFPKYESHYSRSHTSKQYLGQELNLQILYRLYKEKFNDTKSNATNAPLSLSVFRNLFKNLNLKFKKPSNDTCKTCDSLFLKIKSCASEEEKQRLENERQQHQDKASFHYTTKQGDKEESMRSLGKLVVVAFDLQKCLATPNLTSSVSFYKRKLWTFNLTIRNITTKRTYCYVWHEGVAQRGADEIASCLFQFIKDLPEEVEKLVLYSDTCPGQNRNNILPIMFLKALEEKETLKEIDHKFLVPGHTHLECDTDHATIERFVKKRSATISVPQDWVSVIKMTSPRFDVKFMKQTDFFGFSKLLTTHFIKRNVDKDKNSFVWNSIFWLHYKKDSDIGFKYTLDPNEPFRSMSMLRRGRLTSMSNIQILPAYNDPLPIDYLKYKDILDLLPFIDQIYHGFYHSLKHTQTSTTQYTSDSDENFEA